MWPSIGELRSLPDDHLEACACLSTTFQISPAGPPNVYLVCLLFFIFSLFYIISRRDNQISLHLARESLLRPRNFRPLNISHPLTLSDDHPRTLGSAMAANIPSTSSQPYTTTFSFTAPYPPSPAPSAQAQSLAKQRRVSLALPSDSSPRIFPAWSFRDDTGLGVHSADSPQDDDVEKKGGKMRKIANDDSLGADDIHSCTLAGQPSPPLLGATPTNPDIIEALDDDVSLFVTVSEVNVFTVA